MACSPDAYRDGPWGSLSVMNQTYDHHSLSLFRAGQADCAGIARDPRASLRSARWDLERCITLEPIEIASLDREPSSNVPRVCDAVALYGPGLTPHAVFWTDIEEANGALLVLVSVERGLVLEPAPRTISVPIDTLPESPCLRAR
jgi:hypothetical protein